MVVSPQTRGFYSLHSWCTLFMVLGYRLSPLMCILPPSEILKLLFGVLMGDTSLIHCCSSKAPKAIGHCHSVRITWKTSFLFSASSEHPWVGCCRGPATPTSAANRNLAYSWEHSKESQAQAGAWNPLGWGAAPTGLQNLLGSGKEPAQWEVQSQPQIFVTFTPQSLVQLNCVLSSLLVFLLSHL